MAGRRQTQTASAPCQRDDWRPAFNALEDKLADLVERIGERIEFAIGKALKDYTTREDHSGLERKVDELERWKLTFEGANKVERRHAWETRAELQDWLRTLTPYFFGALGFVYLTLKATT